MQIVPRYDGTPVIDIPCVPGAQLAPLVRQRERLAVMLAALDDDAWQAQSRCAEWSVGGVVAHLAGVNAFWRHSVQAGVAGVPSRLLVGFDPAATPLSLVASTSALSRHEVLDRFVASNDAFLRLMNGLDQGDWAKLAECPAGHLPIGLVAAHALWDAWVHERDIALPLGLPSPLEDDELATSLTYASALSPALALSLGNSTAGRFAVDATHPTIRFTLDIGDHVALEERLAEDNTVPRLAGRAADLIEVVSLRDPLPASTPPEWRVVLNGIAAAFDAPGMDPGPTNAPTATTRPLTAP